jgi:hypothetical protein
MAVKKTEEDAIAQGICLMAGLHAAAGKFTIRNDCLKNIQEKRRKKDEQKYQSTLNPKD